MYHSKKIKYTETTPRINKVFFADYVPQDYKDSPNTYIDELHSIKNNIQCAIKTYYNYSDIYPFRQLTSIDQVDLRRVYDDLNLDDPTTAPFQQLISLLMDDCLILDMLAYQEDDFNYAVQKQVVECQTKYFRQKVEEVFKR